MSSSERGHPNQHHRMTALGSAAAMSSTTSLTSVVVGHNNGHGHAHGHAHHGHSHHGHKPTSVPRRHSHAQLLTQLFRETRAVLTHPSSHRTTGLLALNCLSLAALSFWSAATNSLALAGYSYLSWFHLLNLMTCYLSQWVQMKGDGASGVAKRHLADRINLQEDPTVFTLGRGRFEVLAVFSSTVLSELGGMFLLKESLERMLETEEVHTGRLMLGALVCLTTQLATTYLSSSTALSHVVEVASSSWLQEHTSDLSHSVCNFFPGLTRFLLPRANPLALLSGVAFALVFLVDVVIEVNDAHWLDPVCSLLLSLCLVSTLHPLSSYCGRVLLQTTPAHVVPQLDRRLREALTIDGVLEFKNEHFWTVSFGRLAGSLTARVRRDADEQMVLAHITDRLADIVWPLTVQISRDEHALAKLKQTSLRFLNAADGDARRAQIVSQQQQQHLRSPLLLTPQQQQQQLRQNHSTPSGAAAAAGPYQPSPGMSPVADGAVISNGSNGSAASPVASASPAGSVLTSTPKEGDDAGLKQRLLAPPAAARLGLGGQNHNLLVTPPAPLPSAPSASLAQHAPPNGVTNGVRLFEHSKFK